MKTSECLPRRPRPLLALSALLLLWCGCAAPPKEGPLTAEMKLPEVTQSEIYYQLFDFVPRFSRGVEEAADTIVRGTSDPEVQRNALLWKTYSLLRLPASSNPLSLAVRAC